MEVLGVDIGGSGMKAAPVNIETGALTADRFRLPTPRPATPEKMAKTFGKLVRHFQWTGNIGCGFPSVIRNGVAITASNIHKKWIGTDVAALFSDSCGCPVHVLNDADAAGIAEMSFGAGRGRNGVVLLVTVGTGLGSALFLNGILHPNTELGHLELKGDIAEKYASDAVRSRKDLSWKQWGKRLRLYFAHVERLLYPDLIIVGGGLSKKFDRIRKYISVETEIVPATMQNEAGITGAAMAVLDSETSGR